MIKSTAIRSCLQKKWPDWFILSAGGILALMGASQVLGFFEELPALDVTDPIFGCPFRYSILIFGVVEVIAAMFCLFAKGGAWIAGIVAWVVANAVAYRIGLWSMGWHHPYTCLFYLLHALDISPATADRLLSMAGGCLLTGSVAILLKSCFFQSAGGFLKISCISCGGHIEFPAAAVGQKIQCPHCAKNITLLSPA
jgi:ribosomal protein S27E